MFRAYLDSSSGGTTVCIKLLALTVFLDDCLMSNAFTTIDSNLKRIISTNCCIHTVVPPDDGPRYTRNM